VSADDLEDPGVVDLEEDVELDVEHGNGDADGEADGDVVGAREDGEDGRDHARHAVVGSGGTAETGCAHGHELDGTADDEAGVGVTEDDAHQPAHERVLEREELRGVLVGSPEP